MLTKDDKTCTQSRSGSTAASSLESQEHGRNRQNTADGGQHAHGDIWDSGLQVVFANVLEVEVSVEATQPSRQCNEELCERRVDVHEELALDVFRRESAEAGDAVLATTYFTCVLNGLDLLDFIEDDTGGLLDPEEPHCGTNGHQDGQ
jgi:hypothetical protein